VDENCLEETLMDSRAVISLVDDDQSVRDSLLLLLRARGFAAHAFASGPEFLASGDLDRTGCLILDMAMPGMSGLDLHQELLRRRSGIPVVFITATRDDSIRQSVLQRGAVDCLFKPFSEAALLGAVNTALGLR
jgi:FixJ family two-component response regulator